MTKTKSPNQSRFSAFAEALVTPGQKVYSSARPEVIALSTKDKFSLNPKAMELLGLKTGDKVTFFDLAKVKGNEEISQDERFYMAINYRDPQTNELNGAMIGNNKVLSYSQVWSAMHFGDNAITSARPIDMITAGIAVERSTKQGCIAKQKVAYEVVPVLNEDGVNEHIIEEGSEPTEMYMLTKRIVTPHNPDVDEEIDEVSKEEQGTEIE